MIWQRLEVKECCSGLAGCHRQEGDFIPKSKIINNVQEIKWLRTMQF